MRILYSLAAATSLAISTPALAATISDGAASVWLYGGDVIVDSTAPLSDTDGLDPVFVSMSGGTGFDPAFSLWVDGPTDTILEGDVADFSFDGGNILNFVFSVTGSASGFLSNLVELTLTFDDSLYDPFGVNADFSGVALMHLASADEMPAVPLPATLPLLAAALAVPVAFRRRKSA